MIILRKIGSVQSESNVVIADELVGQADGDNQVFAVSYDYVEGSIEVVYNGQILISPEDFEEHTSPTAPELASNEIKFIYIQPTVLSNMRANYQKVS
jgi:hypothetical protein